MYRVLALVAFLSIGFSASAATLQPIKGKVLINHGTGFQRVTQPTAAAIGDSIMVNGEGSAQLVYDAQCSVAVKPGNVITVSAEPPCQKDAQIDFESTRMNAGVKCGDKSFCEPPPEDRRWIGLLPLAAIAVGVGLCVGDVVCDNGASP